MEITDNDIRWHNITIQSNISKAEDELIRKIKEAINNYSIYCCSRGDDDNLYYKITIELRSGKTEIGHVDGIGYTARKKTIEPSA